VIRLAHDRGFGCTRADKWASLLAEGYDVTEEDTYRVALASPHLSIVAVHDPRGEVEVRAFRHGTEPHYGWSYTGCRGTTSYVGPGTA